MSNGQPQQISWPSTVVALGILTLIGAIVVSAIVHYNSVDDALKIWTGLTALLGVVTGAFVSYFFTRGTTQAAQDARKEAENAREEAQTKGNALTATLGLITDENLLDQVRKQPAVAKALNPG